MSPQNPGSILPAGTGRGQTMTVFGHTITERITSEASGGPGQTPWIVTPGPISQTFMGGYATFPPGPPDFARLDALHARHGSSMAPPATPWW